MKKIKLALFGLVAFGSMQSAIKNPFHGFYNTLRENEEVRNYTGAAIVFVALGLYGLKKAWFE